MGNWRKPSRRLPPNRNSVTVWVMGTGIVESLEHRLAGRWAGRLAERVQATNRPWAAQVVSWMDLVDLCRALDESLVSAEVEVPEASALHEAVFSLAIGCGGWLIHEIRATGADISASGHPLDTLDASLELLRILHRSRHPSFSPSEVEAARRGIFNAAA